MNAWRLVASPSGAGDWNMAVDAALIDSVVDSGTCCLRFYSWSEPTVSLGYFQAHADRETHAASRVCPLVRRPTGGGAIVHDREVTYSFITPAAGPLASAAQQLYRLLHETLIGALSEWGIKAVLADRPFGPPAAAEPFLCFRRRAEGDVTLGAHKVAGSAQRRRRGAVLQHGSVLLTGSPQAPELPGITDLGGVQIDARELQFTWRARLANVCRISWQPQPLTADEVKQATRLVEETYSRSAWTLRR